MSTTRLQIHLAAQRHEWTVDERFTGRVLVLRRGERFVSMTFSATGGLTEAHTDTRAFDVDKRGNVLRYLAQGD